MSSPTTTRTEVGILERLFRLREDDLSLAAARAWLRVTFPHEDIERINDLSRKAREGTLTVEEQEELDTYERVGHFVDMMHSKARRALKRRRPRA